jgi:hypothetical protein
MSRSLDVDLAAALLRELAETWRESNNMGELSYGSKAGQSCANGRAAREISPVEALVGCPQTPLHCKDRDDDTASPHPSTIPWRRGYIP